MPRPNPNALATAASEAPDPAAVLAKATVRASQALGLNGAALAKVLGTSEASVSRILAGERTIAPQGKEGELALLLIRVYRSLDALVGNDETLRRAWLDSHHRVLNGTPRRLLGSVQGLVSVVGYLDSMRATV
jgi:transcriptional regulator with XRE-family HTH domain